MAPTGGARETLSHGSERPSGRPGPRRRFTLEDLARYGAVTSWGFTAAGALFLGIWGGRYLDARFGTTPWLTLTGTVLGVTLSLVSLFREIVRLEAKRKGR